MSILTYENGYDNGKETVFFVLNVNCAGKEFNLKKRFQKFDELQAKLAKIHDNLPELPAKTLMKLTKAVDLDKRRHALEKYLKDLVARKDVYSDRTLLEFLELDMRNPELLTKPANLIGTHAETRSVLDFQYWEAQKLMFLALGDFSNILQKSGLFSFGKKKEPVETPGSFTAYLQGKKDSKEPGDFNFQKQWWINSQVPCTASDWSQKFCLLVVGDGGGTLKFIKPYDSNPMKYDEVSSIKVHNDRVIQVVFDEDKKVVYSIGEDRKFKATSWEKKSILNEFEVSAKRPNCMFVDRTARLAYVGDAEGNCRVIDLNKNPPSCINSIKIHQKDSVTSIDCSGSYLFAACHDSGKILAYSYPDPRDVSFAHSRKHCPS